MISVDPHQHLVKFQPLEMRLAGRHQAEQFVAATGVDVNYEYLLSYVLRHAEDKSSPRVLDFGCGNALLVRALLDRGVQCFGAEIFYGARDHRSAHMPGLLSAGIVHQIPPDGRLPFDDDYFDIIFSNQVFEHVEHLDTVVTELSRVLRPNGMMLTTSRPRRFSGRAILAFRSPTGSGASRRGGARCLHCADSALAATNGMHRVWARGPIVPPAISRTSAFIARTPKSARPSPRVPPGSPRDRLHSVQSTRPKRVGRARGRRIADTRLGGDLSPARVHGDRARGPRGDDPDH